MAAATADLKTPRQLGNTRSFPVDVSALLYAGTLVCWNTATNYLVDGADAASRVFAGVASARRDNSSGAAGDISAELFDEGNFLFAHGQAITNADLGKRVYLADNATVDFLENVTNPIYVGVLVGIDDSGDAWVKIQPDAPTPAQARQDRVYQVAITGVNATAFDLAAAAVEYGGTGFAVSNLISAQSFVTATGASDGLKVETADWTLAAGVISTVGDETLNTWLLTFLGVLQDG